MLAPKHILTFSTYHVTCTHFLLSDTLFQNKRKRFVVKIENNYYNRTVSKRPYLKKLCLLTNIGRTTTIDFRSYLIFLSEVKEVNSVLVRRRS